LFFLSKFAWKPIVSALDEREKFIENALAEAEKARVERDVMLKEDRAAANLMIEEAKERGNKEYNALLESSRLDIRRERDAAIATLQTQVADLTITIAEKILKKQLDNAPASKELVNTYLKDLKLN